MSDKFVKSPDVLEKNTNQALFFVIFSALLANEGMSLVPEKSQLSINRLASEDPRLAIGPPIAKRGSSDARRLVKSPSCTRGSYVPVFCRVFRPYSGRRAMRSVGQHLLLYDGECGLCDGVVHAVLKRDRHKRFCFAPLQGSTAAQYLQRPELAGLAGTCDSVILIERFRLPTAQIYLRSQAVWRVCWYLGGGLALLGLLSFLPGWLFDWGYGIVARMRYRIFGRVSCHLPSSQSQYKEQFLP